MHDILYNYVKNCLEGTEKFDEGVLYVRYQEERMRRTLQARGRPRFRCSREDFEHACTLKPAEGAAYLGCSLSTFMRLKHDTAR